MIVPRCACMVTDDIENENSAKPVTGASFGVNGVCFLTAGRSYTQYGCMFHSLDFVHLEVRNVNRFILRSHA